MDMRTESTPVDKKQAEKPSVYRCTSCGVTMQSNGTPKVCTKCDNAHFFKVDNTKKN